MPPPGRDRSKLRSALDGAGYGVVARRVEIGQKRVVESQQAPACADTRHQSRAVLRSAQHGCACVVECYLLDRRKRHAGEPHAPARDEIQPTLDLAGYWQLP